MTSSPTDKGTGKEQKIRIESSSGLSEEEVERMRRDAEAHASEDKARRELVDLKNQVEAIVHETDKQVAEHGDKLSDADKAGIESAKEALKKAAEGDDKAALEKALQEFQTKAQKLGEILYKESAAGGDAGAASGPGPEPKGSAGAPGGDEPVDADFEVKT